MSRRSLALLAFSLIVAGAALASLRVWWHEQWDQVRQEQVKLLSVEASEVDAGRLAFPLLVTASPEQDVFVRLCADAALGEVAPDSVAVRLEAEGSAGTRWSAGPVADEDLGPIARDDCLFFTARGRGGGGKLELTWARGALGHHEYLEATAAVRHPLGWLDRGVLVLLLGGLALLLVAGQKTRPLAEAPWAPGDMVTVILVFFLASVAVVALGGNQATALLGGLVSYGAYVAACWILAERVAPGNPLAALRFHRVAPRVWSLAAAVGLALAVLVSVVLLLVPQGESPMTQVLQTSGGMVSVIALALISPWSEEFLLRGVIYGSLERWAGPLAAVLGSALIFSLLHLGQHWGNLAPWVTLTVTGLVLSGVRWRTGSTLASTVTHLVYNLALALPVLLTG